MNKYPVIKLDIPTVFSDLDKTKPFEVAFNQCILKDIYKYYPTVEKENFSSVALAQIIDKHYSDKLRGYKEVIALGINYDEKDKNYTA